MKEQTIRSFGLAPAGSARGISCDASGAFVGGVPLLKRMRDENGSEVWQPRDCEGLSAELSKVFSIPVDISPKFGGISAIARALNNGEVARAQIATLNLQFPNPPSHRTDALSRGELIKLIQSLDASGLIKADWDPDQHPRWPAGAPDSQGGEFAPKDQATDATSDDGVPAADRGVGSLGSATSYQDLEIGESSDAASDVPAVAYDSDEGLFDPAAYPGDYHDELVNEIADYLRSKGLKVETELPIEMADGSGGTRIDILAKGKIVFGIEVKTGENPGMTRAQLYVYPHLIMGGSVLSPNPRIANLGLPPMVPLPPIPILGGYAKGAGSKQIFFGPRCAKNVARACAAIRQTPSKEI